MSLLLACLLAGPGELPVKLTWNDGDSGSEGFLRLRAGDRSAPLPWIAPFLFVAARVRGEAALDLFIDRRTAFRAVEGRGLRLVEADPAGRTERETDLAGFARAVLDRGRGAAINEGVGRLARGEPLEGLDFRNPSDYDDYLFWIYNLALSQHRE